MTGEAGDLAGLKVLLVEDNLLLAEVITDALEVYGCHIVGPVGTLEAGLALAREAAVDVAILDINLRGEPCFPIAGALSDRGVPYLFLTGYDNSRLIPPKYRSAERLAKPVDPVALTAAITAHLRGRALH